MVNAPIRSATNMAELYRTSADKFCFLCGDQVHAGISLSAEHIIPQWLIRQAGLDKSVMQLPNFEAGASYRNFLRSKVDCCLNCNNSLSRVLEPPVKEILNSNRQGYLRKEHRDMMLLWMAKIYYANSFAGMSFAADPSQINNPDHIKLTNRTDHLSYLDNIQAHLFDLVRSPGSISNVKLGSIFTFRCLPMPESQPEFYYADGHQQMPAVVFRYKSLGLVAYFAGGDRAESMFDSNTLRWVGGKNPYELDVDHIMYAKRVRLINEQLLDIASIVAQLGTACFDVPPPKVPGRSYARPFPKESSFGGQVILPYRRYYLQTLLAGNREFLERWENNGESLLFDKKTRQPITFSYVQGPREGALEMSNVRKTSR